MKFTPFILLLGLLAGCGSDGRKTYDTWHPEVFSMIESWISDPESPVVTEVNLDAVQRNGNQFDQKGIKQENGWIIYRAEERGFKRYRVIERNGSHYKVEYQENGGGTLTTDSVIEFSIDKREIRRDEKPILINVLRVSSYIQNRSE
jgi:hypothetical protein